MTTMSRNRSCAVCVYAPTRVGAGFDGCGYATTYDGLRRWCRGCACGRLRCELWAGAMVGRLPVRAMTMYDDGMRDVRMIMTMVCAVQGAVRAGMPGVRCDD